jgi:serine phosphatase RsbU (regulator of sigma subunit)
MVDAPNPQDRAEPRQMQCLEIWGGTGAARESVSVHGLDIYVLSEPYAGQVAGGDIYMASMCGAGDIARLALADVAGHGVVVSSVADSLRSLMRKHVGTVDQTELARDLNAEFTAMSKEGVFATAVLVTYFAPTHHLIVVNAGHPPPLWYRADIASWQLLEPGKNTERAAREVGVSNLPLGIIEPTNYRQFAVELRQGDIVALYTDACIEARDPRGEQLGLGGLLELARTLDVSDLEAIPGAFQASLQAFRAGQPPDDDQTIFVLHHNAAEPPRRSFGQRLRVLGKMVGIGRPRPRHA